MTMTANFSIGIQALAVAACQPIITFRHQKLICTFSCAYVPHERCLIDKYKIVFTDGVATVDALVAVLGADRVCMASVDHWKLGKPDEANMRFGGIEHVGLY